MDSILSILLLSEKEKTFEVKERAFERALNKYKEKYFFFDKTENIENYRTEAFRDLELLRDFLQRFLHHRFPPLISNLYINNRIKMRKIENQYRKEIAAKTQCLRANNTVFIDPNHDIDVLGFNNTPWIQFKFVGLAIGEYKITIPDDLPFGILYDHEEVPNKKFNYDVEEKSLEISGTKLGDTVIIREDKWINAPGDVDDDDKFDSLLNIGPEDFTVEFYTGEITLKVTGNFGIVSYYIKDKGYMGGQKRLKFSEICIIDDGESNN